MPKELRMNQVWKQVFSRRCVGLFAALVLSWLAPICRADQEGIPALDHVWLIVMENEASSKIMGNANAPFINSLASSHSQASNYTAVTHPSLPNYIAMISGQFNDNAGHAINTDSSPNWGSSSNTGSSYGRLTSPNLADQLLAAGKTWKSYQESLPDSGAYGVNEVLNSSGGQLYAVKHDPFAYFATIQGSNSSMANIVPLTRLSTDLAGTAPNLSFIVPSICNDMHGGAGCPTGNDLILTGDNTVKSLYQAITAAPVWQQGKNVIIITWDEDDYSSNNHVPFVAVTNYAVAGGSDATAYNHYSLLRTLEDGFSLGNQYLGGAANAVPMTALFKTITSIPSTPTGISATGKSRSDIQLNWTASAGASSYKVYRAASSAGPFTTPLTTVTTNSYTDTGLSANTTYFYQIAAVNSNGSSANSSTVVATTTNSYASNFPTMNLRGSMNSWGNTAMALVGNNTWQTTVTLAPSTAYNYKYDASGTWVSTKNWGLGSSAGIAQVGTGNIAFTTGTATSYTFTFNDSTLAYSVAAFVVDTQPPAAPTNLISTASTANSITLSWTAAADNVGISRYKIIRNGVKVGTSTSTTFTDTGLQPGTSYIYWLKATDTSFNSGPHSAAVTLSTAPAQ